MTTTGATPGTPTRPVTNADWYLTCIGRDCLRLERAGQVELAREIRDAIRMTGSFRCGFPRPAT